MLKFMLVWHEIKLDRLFQGMSMLEPVSKFFYYIIKHKCMQDPYAWKRSLNLTRLKLKKLKREKEINLLCGLKIVFFCCLIVTYLSNAVRAFLFLYEFK